MSPIRPGEFDRAELAKTPVRKRPTRRPAKVGVKAQRKLRAR